MRNKPKYLLFLKDNIKIVGAFVLCIIFLFITLIMVRTGPSLLLVIPPALLIILLAFLDIDRFLIITVLLVPVSIQLRFIIPDIPADIFIPTELMLAWILILVIFKILSKREINKDILTHPVTIISCFILGWNLITSFTSTLPLVSFKSFITRLWFFAGFYLLAAEIFKKPEKIKKYFYAYIAGMVPVIIYFLLRMLEAGFFNEKAAHSAIRPFFNDHTSFGAALAFCIPVIIYLLTGRNTSKTFKVVLFFLLFIFSVAFIVSYSRAAWLSLFIAGLIVLFLLLRISWKVIIPATVLIIVLIFVSWSSLIMKLNENTQESSGNIKKHLLSITNIRSDASNMERVNRWKAALRMSREKPFLGWGPATYQFKYAPYQMASEKTIISTNYGEGGNAHSEYLGSLVDSGIPGPVMYILLIFISIWRGIEIWRTNNNKQIKYLALALVAGLVTYAVHGIFNNFLDTDKISALFWGMIAGIVATDISMKNEKTCNELSQVSCDN